MPRRRKVLLLGVSYPCLPTILRENGIANDDLEHPLVNDVPTVETALECIEEGHLTQMDGRDLVRCLLTEQSCGVDVYTVSQEKGAHYRSDRHLDVNFNRSKDLIKALKSLNDNLHFHQIVLDYFWIPHGWDTSHWRRSLFNETLPRIHSFLEIDRRRTNYDASPSINLPFCLHCFQQVLGCAGKLLDFYDVAFCRSLDQVVLWKGTQQINPTVCQTVLGKRRDQEEIYCTFGQQDIQCALDDEYVTKEQVWQTARRLEDFDKIRFIRLMPIANGEQGSFLGLKEPEMVRRGISKTKAALTTTPGKQKTAARREVVTVSPAPTQMKGSTPTRRANPSPRRAQRSLFHKKEVTHKPSKLLPRKATKKTTPDKRRLF